ncbi:alpha-1,4-N-acetylglucosaminyltransferase-like isoform X3 [Hypanus sabinus]|uniref:alpha-1,4-N-acetylglucosaminyltransferase-like isoform X3 n=1 Tax=Hypanus sabinus TaxID=79690 RepID=UPI0028C50C44|nr:alpha-1,4-N-acetylglucosaminyltransferase-like isoform X3 [Hypanus sabinus]
MLSLHKGCLVVLVLVICSTLYMYYRYYWSVNDDMLKLSRVTDKPDAVIPNKVFKAGIMFLESTDNLKLMPLAMCSVESAARLNPDKQIYYFMKGFSGNLSQYPETEYRGIHLLSKMKNIVILPLKPIELFKDTPLESWYQKVNPEREKYWAHVLADGCRLALLWKYGGIYLDTDIISLRFERKLRCDK